MQRIEVENDTIRAAQGGDQDAMMTVIDACGPMLSSIIRTVAPTASADAREDYLQEARATLIQHVRDYDTDASSARLTTYAYQAVRRSVTEAHVTNECAVSVPPAAAMAVRRALWESGRDLEAAWRIIASADERHRMKRETFHGVVQALEATSSLDALVGDDSDGSSLTLSETLVDAGADVTAPMERCDLARWLMTQIPARQSLALRAYYGVGMTRQDDSELCAVMEVKPPTLRQLRTRGAANARAVATTRGLVA
ncbi:sigma factor [Streptomyces spectabilis]|uniref:sigma factor n=1 Tax=Streptomyces spectabilis TaxID=68270 RepID=UPI0033E423DA